MAGDQAFLAKDQLALIQPDLDELENMLRRARLQMRLAMKADSAHKAFWAMQAAVQSFWQSAQAAQVMEEADSASNWPEITQHFQQQLIQFYAALKANRYREDILADQGDQLLRLAENFVQIYAPDQADLLAAEQELLAQYRQRMNFYADPLLYSPDRLLRRKAHLELDARLSGMQSEQDSAFEKLLDLRRQLAGKAGRVSFTSLAWQRLQRFDYQPAQLEELKAAVRRYIVPLTRQIRALQQQRLEVEHLAWYDLPCLLAEANQLPPVSDELLLAAGDAVLNELSGTKNNLLAQMAGLGYLEFSSLPVWQNELKIIPLQEPAQPYVAVSVIPASSKVENLLLAAGRTYAARCAQKKQQLFEYQQPAPEMELFFGLALNYLAMDYLKGLFGPSHDDYCLVQLTKALLEMPLACLVDDFENRIYERPQLTASQCNEIWQSLAAVYLPDYDYEQMPYFTSGRGWQAEPAIWLAPHSSINQLTARLMALELWRTGRQEPQKAWQIYNELCQQGGSGLTLTLISQAGLDSPLAVDTLKRIAYAVCDSLAL